MVGKIVERKVDISSNAITHAMERELKLKVKESLDDLSKVRLQVTFSLRGVEGSPQISASSGLL
jgi:hypothetical protein